MQPAICGLKISWDLPPAVTPILIPKELPMFMDSGSRLTLYAMLTGVDFNVSVVYFFPSFIVFT